VSESSEVHDYFPFISDRIRLVLKLFENAGTHHRGRLGGVAGANVGICAPHAVKIMAMAVTSKVIRNRL
jgi:hypothetical protein